MSAAVPWAVVPAEPAPELRAVRGLSGAGRRERLGVADGTERLGVSYSQVAASNGTRPAALLVGVVSHLAARVRQAGGRTPPATDPLLGSLVIQDSTFLRLSLRLAGWLPTLRRPEVSGVRIQRWLVPCLDLPEVIDLTSVKLNDRQSWDRSVLGDPVRLATLVGQTLVVDLGSYRHVGFQCLFAAGVHLVTRLYPKTTVTVEADRPVQPPLPEAAGGRITVVADQRVTLGSPNNHTSTVLRGLRLVTADVTPRAKTGHRSPTPRRYEIITDRWDLTAAEVVQVYLWPWQIEPFLRWLKGQLHLTRLLGSSENAVELSVGLAILVHLLTLLAARALGLARRSPLLLARLAVALLHLDLDRDTAPAPLAQLPLPGFLLHPDAPT
ncbi:MAG TPA: transposase [Chloroflexota bacterium]|nr:transposase [Chloroflexota bacterium]